MGNLNQYYSKLLHIQRRVDETIDDILLEAEDMGLKVNKRAPYQSVAFPNGFNKSIEISGEVHSKEVKPIVDRLCDYLKQEKFNPKVEYDGDHVTLSLRRLKHELYGKVYHVKITY